VIARFEAERQALALMDHPNIARVLDAGTSSPGRPYFVMDLVKGVPVTRYCDENRLTPRQRLELFLPVCRAVQHAHQKGVIHRDLKPSNVLVALYDGRPVPKVIDFGVAKAAGPGRAGAGRTGLDRDAGAGEGPRPPLRDRQRLRDGRAAIPGRRAGAGLSAVGGVSAPEVRTAEQGGTGGGRTGAVLPDPAR